MNYCGIPDEPDPHNALTGALSHAGVLDRAPIAVDPSARIDDGATLERTTIGAGARVGKGARLVDCVVWDGAEVADGEVLTRTIVTPQVRVPVPATPAPPR